MCCTITVYWMNMLYASCMHTQILSALASGGRSGTDPGLPLHSDSSANCGHQWRLCSCHTIQGTVKISFRHWSSTTLEFLPRVVCLLAMPQWRHKHAFHLLKLVTYGEQLKKQEKMILGIRQTATCNVNLVSSSSSSQSPVLVRTLSQRHHSA